jgi:hypothetical protein
VFAVFTIVKPGVRIVTVAEHPDSAPVGQLFPGASDWSAIVTRLSVPVSGFKMVIVETTVTTPPTGISPVQYPPVGPTTNDPDVVVCVLLATSPDPARALPFTITPV